MRGLSDSGKRWAYRNGKFAFSVPPVATDRWSESDWIRYIDARGVWVLGREGYDRFAIAIAYWAYMCQWHSGGVTDRDRKRNRRLANGQMDTISAQLHRLKFRPGMGQSDDPEQFEDDGTRWIYWQLVGKYEGWQHVPPEYVPVKH